MLWRPVHGGEVTEWKLTVIDSTRGRVANVTAHEEWLDPLEGGVTFADSADTDRPSPCFVSAKSPAQSLAPRRFANPPSAHVYPCWHDEFGNLFWDQNRPELPQSWYCAGRLRLWLEAGAVVEIKAKIMFAFLSPCAMFPCDVFNRCFMCSSPARAISCSEHARLEEEYTAVRDRMRNLLGLRELTRIEQRRLADEVAMAIARLKEHAAAHGCARR